MKEQLKEVIKNLEITKEIKKKIDLTLYRTPGVETFLVTKIRENILSGNMNDINDDQAKELLNTLGVKPVREIKKETVVNTEENQALQNMYNTALIEIEQLRKENKKRADEIKAKDEDFKKMQEQIQLNTKALEEIERLKKKVKILKKFEITQTHELFEVPEEDINSLYLEYITDGIKKSKIAYIIEQDNKLIIPKAYYVVERGDE